MKSRLLLIFLLAVSTFGCKKGAGTFTIKGIITDETFNTGLSGATIELYKVPVASNNEILVESKTLGNDGAYEFTFPREQIEKYIIRVNKNLHFPIESMIYYSSLEVGNDNIRNYVTAAKAWVEIRLINNSPNASDHLIYTKQQGLDGCLECCPITEQNFYGAIDTSIYCINKGNTTYSILYQVYGTNNTALKEAITVPFDTTQIYLAY
ncbi:MAG: hypothetical protein FJZ67_10315 [Bacteroidetes bacterium]|nr:hypothetical protein [Bacteroidota bacterium]